MSTDPASAPDAGPLAATGALAVVAIHLGAHRVAQLRPVESVSAVAGKGLEGDRHYQSGGAQPGQALTLVEESVVEAAGLPPGGTRRQLTVRGVGLSEMIGERFRVGEVECYGVELCEPCEHLQSLTRPGIIKELTHRAGIRADILSSGTISVGDVVRKL